MASLTRTGRLATAWLLALLALSGCETADCPSSGDGACGCATDDPSEGGGSPFVDYCDACAFPTAAGALQNPQIETASGLAASRLHPGVFYVHNNWDVLGLFFATDSTGSDLGSYALSGVGVWDVQDCAVGPCPSGSCLYLGDIGDSALVRSSYVIHRIPEPDAVRPGAHVVSSEPIRFRYPDGAHRARTLLVHPDTGEIVVVTLVESGAAEAYRLPDEVEGDEIVTLESLGEIELWTGSPLINGGDVHPLAEGILLRADPSMLFVPMADGEDISTGLFGPPCVVPVALEPAGHAVAWTAAGDGYLTTGHGIASTLNAVSCRP